MLLSHNDYRVRFSSSSSLSSSAASSSLVLESNNDPQQQHVQRLVLIGGGHAHVQVIKALGEQHRSSSSRTTTRRRTAPRIVHNNNHVLCVLHVTVMDANPVATYSGMVPGCIAGLYAVEETQLHLPELVTHVMSKPKSKLNSQFSSSSLQSSSSLPSDDLHIVMDFIHGRVTNVRMMEEENSNHNNGTTQQNHHKKWVEYEPLDEDEITTNHNNISDQKRMPPRKTKTCILPFDVVSLDIGSSSKHVHTIPGALEFSIPTRPIQQLITRLDTARRRYRARLGSETNSQSDPHVVVVGGGAAGLELALSISCRWRPKFPRLTMTLVHAGSNLLETTGTRGGGGGGGGDDDDGGVLPIPSPSQQQQQQLSAVLHEKGIRVLLRTEVTRVCADSVHVLMQNNKKKKRRTRTSEEEEEDCASILELPCTHCIWATGAGPTALARALAHQGDLDMAPLGDSNNHHHQGKVQDQDEKAWIQVASTLQSTSHPFVFAVGDCASLVVPTNDHHSCQNDEKDINTNKDTKSWKPVRLPKAGVYAVRAGPVLYENLMRYLASVRVVSSSTPPTKQPLPRYEPGGCDCDPLLIEYQPQEDFLKLIVCGHQDSLGFRFNLALRGPWVWQLKNHIDQTFMNLFRVPTPETTLQTTTADNTECKRRQTKKPIITDNNDPDDENEDERMTTTLLPHPPPPHDHPPHDHPQPQSPTTLQYDAAAVTDLPPDRRLSARDAAQLLLREDDQVDYMLAWQTIRAMAADIRYRDAVQLHYDAAIMTRNNSPQVLRVVDNR